jgi:hypothetical protein
METYTVTYNVTLTIEVQADSADRRNGSRTVVASLRRQCAVSCHHIATSIARMREDKSANWTVAYVSDAAFAVEALRPPGSRRAARRD